MFIIIYRNETKTGIIITSSEGKSAINTPSDFTTVFERPIVLGGNQRYVIGLDNVNTMTYSWHNVSPDYQNNIISYHNGKEYKRIEFSNGCYDYTELSDYIKETLITNDDLEPDQASPITIEFEPTVQTQTVQTQTQRFKHKHNKRFKHKHNGSNTNTTVQTANTIWNGYTKHNK